VRAAIEFGVEIEALPAGARKELLPELARVDLSKELSVDAVLARRSAIGGTAPKRVLAEARAWKKKLATR
jgi:argininosuccinate lyase